MTAKGLGVRRVAPRNGNCPEAEAWVRVAEFVANPANPMPYGLCWIAANLGERLYDVMRKRCESHVEFSPDRSGAFGAFAYPKGTEREARVLACLWMALEAAEEYDTRSELRDAQRSAES